MTKIHVPLGWQAPYIGTPWVFDGYDKKAVSCWGFACLAWKDVADILLPTFSEKLPQDPVFSPARIRAVNKVIENEISIFKKIQTPKPLCLVQMRKGQHLTHIGVYAFGGWVAHSCEDTGAVIQERVDDIENSITGYFWPSQAILEA